MARPRPGHKQMPKNKRKTFYLFAMLIFTSPLGHPLHLPSVR